jgi:transcriptional regulator with XRE-family HTH domain
MGRFDELGRALRLARLEQGKKQTEIAALAQISKSTLSKYETGAQCPTLATLDRLLDALGLTLCGLEQRLGAGGQRAGEGQERRPPPHASPPAIRPADLDLPGLFGLPPERLATADAALAAFFRALRDLMARLR